MMDLAHSFEIHEYLPAISGSPSVTAIHYLIFNPPDYVAEFANPLMIFEKQFTFRVR